MMAVTGPLWALWDRRLSQRRLLMISMLGMAVTLGTRVRRQLRQGGR